MQPSELPSVDPELLTLRNLNTRQDYLDALSTAGFGDQVGAARPKGLHDISPAPLPVILGHEAAEAFAAQHRRRIAVQRGVEKPIG